MLTSIAWVAARLSSMGGAATLTTENGSIEGLYLAAMTKGTEKYDKSAFDALATTTGTAVGSDLNKGIPSPICRPFTTISTNHGDLLYPGRVASDVSESEVELSRQQIVFGLKQKVDDPDSHLRLASDSVYYAGHPYAVEVDGTPESVAAFNTG